MNVIVVIKRSGGVVTDIEAFIDVNALHEAGYDLSDGDEENWPHWSLLIQPEVAVQGLDA